MSAVTKIEARELAPVTDQNAALLQVIARAASDPAVDIDKMERLLAMQERVMERNAEAAFNEAMRASQGDMRQVATDANNPQTRSRYATYAAIDAALRPIYTRHGFSISYGTADAPEGYVRVLAYVSHVGGHTRRYEAAMPADGKGAKGGDVMTKTHAFGAATSYGMRYLLKMIFNVAIGEYDLDGNEPTQRPEVPAELLQKAREAALQGTAHYKAYFSMLTAEQRRSLLPEHESLKAAASQADQGAE